ncbi:sugar O-acyltransferase, sialic acid O-acetyltransferase NeuD family protein [Galbibacter marinus]|uniref:Sugar O-acyltransferase, sialic acid O-acetyltransferase NeuD family protein n=1 Tax=Galbibacter marinus TaxID=555500 RepID=K2Q0M3_9FLAO|nr:acetyltransferase [Galbibacter marinus]EKF54436.1 sugar O-acyltransferase, sialic acid O-acetyltransferase NeuD family protein [Galbibacter marinus]
MSEFKNIYILGYSGHAYVVVESALSNNHTIQGYFDTKANEDNPYRLTFCGNEKEVDLKAIVGDDYVFPTVGDNELRKKISETLEQYHFNQFTIIDKSAKVSKTAKINVSTYVSSGAIINARAVIGKACVINTAAIVEHECIVGDFSHIAPGAVLLGNVKVGEESFIGANSVIKEGVSIGDHVIVGAGSVVIKDLPSHTTWVGNPARRIK